MMIRRRSTQPKLNMKETTTTTAKEGRKLGEVLADILLNGDIHEAPWQDSWLAEGQQAHELSTEEQVILDITATILKLTNGGQGGSCSKYDELVRPFLQQIVPGTKE